MGGKLQVKQQLETGYYRQASLGSQGQKIKAKYFEVIKLHATHNYEMDIRQPDKMDSPRQIPELSFFIFFYN